MRFHASGWGAFLPDSLPCANSRRRGIPSFRGRGHSPSPAVRTPSAGDVASPPFGGEVLAQASLRLQSSPHLRSFRFRTASLGRKLNSVPYLPPRLSSPLRILPSPSRSTVISLASLVGALVGSLVGSLVRSLVGSLVRSLVGSLVGLLVGLLVGGKVVDSTSG